MAKGRNHCCIVFILMIVILVTISICVGVGVSVATLSANNSKRYIVLTYCANSSGLVYLI